MDQFKSLKQMFSKFVGHFDLEGQGQGHKFSNSSKIFMLSIYGSSFKIKFKTPQNLSYSQGITQTMTINDADDDHPKKYFSPRSGGGGDINIMDR